MKKPSFPQPLYVKRDREGYLVASENLFDIADEDGSSTPYGLYRLAATRAVRLVVESTDPTPATKRGRKETE